jgi:glycosyltransferase involved in cell wall biosynthesis
MLSYSLSVFFPAYNEEKNIENSVEQAEAVLKTLTPEYEIIIVNDGSRDKTGKIADALAAKNKHIKVVHHNPNQGYGAAVWSGIQASTGDYIFFTDADLQFDLQELTKLVQFVPEYKAVIGYRAKRRDPLLRLLNAKGWNILNRFLFGLKVKDVDCAFKLFKRDLVQHLPIKSRGAMMSAELLIRLQREGVVFKEVPVTHLPRTAGSPTGAKPSVILRAFKELLLTYRGDLGNVTHRQAVKFMSVGFINTLLDIAIYFSLTRLSPFFATHFVTAKILSYGTGSLTGFFMNRSWTFRRRGPLHASELMRYYTTVAFALCVNAGTMYALVHLLHFHDLVAAFLATLFSFAVNFTTSKLWVFAHKRG